MTNPLVNSSSFLRTSRNFPQEAQPLVVELSKMYLDVAQQTNIRTIGIFPTNRPAVTGESWYLSGEPRNQTLREVFVFSSAGNITHNINFFNITGIVSIYGTFTDGTNWYPLPYVDVVNANNQVNIIVTPTVITIATGAGSPPSITSGYVVLTWLSNV